MAVFCYSVGTFLILVAMAGLFVWLMSSFTFSVIAITAIAFGLGVLLFAMGDVIRNFPPHS
jgi:multisubunit Na+/H+ antiporter MnhC subunit